MSTFTISAVSTQAPRLWGDDMASYRVHLAADDGTVTQNVELSRKTSQPLPTVGEKLTGDIDTSGSYGPKFKIQRVGGGGFNRGGPRPEDPKRAAMILRQHSQHMALQYAALRHSQGKLPEEFKFSDLLLIVDQFDADAKKAGAAA